MLPSTVMIQQITSPEAEAQNYSQDVIVKCNHVESAHTILAHKHLRGQLLFISGGNLSVKIENEQWSVTPQQAVWIPPLATHEVSSSNGLVYCSAYIDESSNILNSIRSGTVVLSTLSRELMHKCATFAEDYKRNSPEARLEKVLLDELTSISNDDNAVPLPSDPRLLTICNTVLAKPWLDKTLSDWSEFCGASERTLARLFKAQTGLTFSQWRDKARVSYAIDQIAKGNSLTTISVNLGYSRLSTFTSMYKRTTGLPPSKHVKKCLFERTL